MLKEKLQNDLNLALREKDELRRVVLSSLVAAIVNKEKEKRTKLSKTTQDVAKLEKLSILTDDEIIEVISSEVKKRKEAIEQYKAGDRQELANKEKKELDILLSYMPEQMDEEKIRDVVKSVISELGIEKDSVEGGKNIGKVMAEVMKKIKGKAEGGIVSKIVKEELS